MSKETDYSGKLYQNDKLELNPDEIKDLIGKTDLDLNQLACYLNKYGNNVDENGENKPVSYRTLINYIGRICELTEGKLCRDDFKFGKSYRISPTIQGYLLCLFDSDYFDTRQNDRKVDYRTKSYKNILKNIESYLFDKDTAIVKKSLLYVNVSLENELTKRFNNELTLLIREIFHSDPMIRYQFMEHSIYEISRIRKWISKEQSMMFSSKLVYGHEVKEIADNEKLNGDLYKKLFQAKSLEEYLITLLVFRVRGEKIDFEEDDYFLSDPAAYVASQIYNINYLDGSEVAQKMSNIDKHLYDVKRHNELMDKMVRLFDKSDPYESLIMDAIEKLSKVYNVAPYLDEKDTVGTKKFIEDIIKHDMWDLLNQFLQLGRGNVSQDEIDRINKYRNRELTLNEKKVLYNSSVFADEK
ncbi:hypothetical protein F8154_04295 [Alkaliphilus pronyensis]|uniref:Uncharacterized protein n=1 Tax=Alkaliphilus pronyensis TaxID=1482732 RepID=A0A6I0FBZ6_9FIRM|nr:hypothetical protein [Alkaliphilus pronyensis]KAB3536303.1 hypothetical protein F8154_04295 [Alkaliphilus pronyensis]